MKRLVLITGTGRSGTSTMSGTLHHLGLHVPGPYLRANQSNPKGFFESRWSVRFHQEIINAAGIQLFDARPEAHGLAQAAITPELRSRLAEFLVSESDGRDQVVVKDPRSVWVQALWRQAADDAGMGIRYLSMLRHPAEVVGSRTTYYGRPADDAARRSYATVNVARWINSSLISERETRGQQRAFVGYPELLADWRSVAARLGQDLDLTYDVDLMSGERCRVDEFIDPGLRRHRVTWDDLQVPGELQDIADRTWAAFQALATGGGENEASSAQLDQQAKRYRFLFSESADLARDEIHAAAAEAHRAGIRQARARMTERAANRPAPTGRAPIADLPVGQVRSRELVKVIARRARRRLRR